MQGGCTGRTMGVKLGVKQKLSLIFFLFFLIFSGTVFVLLFNVQTMVATTEKIVINNKKLDELAETLKTSLLNMDASHRN